MNRPLARPRRRLPGAGRQRRRAAAGLAALALAAAACTPTWNWREVRPSGGGYAVLLPGKPASASRPIDLDGLPVTMTMTGARVGETMFTVGAVQLPDGAPATREKATAAMRTAMVRNIGGRESAHAGLALAVLDAGGREVARQPGVRIDAEGRVGDRPMHLAAQFVARGDRAWQAVVMGREADPEHARQFLDSFRIVE